MNYSYWEREIWFKGIDYAIIGAGIVGLTTAYFLRKKFPRSKIVIFEKNTIPNGASTKNAGFACFGSVSELMADINDHGEFATYNLVKERWEGLNILQEILNGYSIDLQNNGGYEIFLKDKAKFSEYTISNIGRINDLLLPIFKDKVFSIVKNEFGYRNIQKQLIFNKFESQLDTGKMMLAFINVIQKKNIQILFGKQVDKLNTDGSFQYGDELIIPKIHTFLCTNGFSKTFLDIEVQPARAQVLITKPIPNLSIKGTFHLDEGFYYFRNINNRVLFGGGRNLNFEGEKTIEFGTTIQIRNNLYNLLKSVILPSTNFEVDCFWSGIMGVGERKEPIVKSISDKLSIGVRLGGMGVALGSKVGNSLSSIV